MVKRRADQEWRFKGGTPRGCCVRLLALCDGVVDRGHLARALGAGSGLIESVLGGRALHVVSVRVMRAFLRWSPQRYAMSGP